MEIKLTLNGERIVQDIEPDLLPVSYTHLQWEVMKNLALF